MGINNALKLRAAGMKIVLGSDTGQTRFIGWMGQLEFENWVGWLDTRRGDCQPAIRRQPRASTPGMVAAGRNADFIGSTRIRSITSEFARISKVYLRDRKWIAPG
jgi:hypothetical protein